MGVVKVFRVTVTLGQEKIRGKQALKYNATCLIWQNGGKGLPREKRVGPEKLVRIFIIPLDSNKVPSGVGKDGFLLGTSKISP